VIRDINKTNQKKDGKMKRKHRAGRQVREWKMAMQAAKCAYKP